VSVFRLSQPKTSLSLSGFFFLLSLFVLFCLFHVSLICLLSLLSAEGLDGSVYTDCLRLEPMFVSLFGFLMFPFLRFVGFVLFLVFFRFVSSVSLISFAVSVFWFFHFRSFP
jgi:hypothetical protein